MRDLIAADVSAALVARVQAYVFSAESPRSIRGESSEIILSRRRKADRERKKAAYLLMKQGGGKQTMSTTFSEEKTANGIAPSSLTSLFSSTSVDPLAIKQGSKVEVVARRDRGTRLPDNWKLSPALVSLALELGHSPAEFETEFKDFWIAIPGTRGRKCDWEATARNRMRETSKRRINGHGTRTISTAADDLIARAEAAERGDDFGAIDVEFHRVKSG